MKNRFKTDDFKLLIDSINYDRPGYILNKTKNQKSAIIIEYQKSGKIYNSYKTSLLDFKITDAYIKPIIINVHQDGSGYDIDSVLYVTGKFNCQFNAPNDTIRLNKCEFRSLLYIKDFNEK